MKSFSSINDRKTKPEKGGNPSGMILLLPISDSEMKSHDAAKWASKSTAPSVGFGCEPPFLLLCRLEAFLPVPVGALLCSPLPEQGTKTNGSWGFFLGKCSQLVVMATLTVSACKVTGLRTLKGQVLRYISKIQLKNRHKIFPRYGHLPFQEQ